MHPSRLGPLQLIVASIVAATLASTVKLGSNGVSNVREFLKLFVEVLSHSRGGVLLEPVLSLLDGLNNGLLVLVINLATETIVVVDLVLQVICVVLELVARLNALTGSLVLIGVLLGFLNHALDFLSRETALVVGDSDALGLASTLVNCRDLENAVGIELEGDLDLGNATGRRAAFMLMFVSYSTWRKDVRDVGELELAEVIVVLCHTSFAFEYLDQNHRLVVGSGGEDLALLGGNGGTTLDEVSHDSTSGLDTESKRVDVHEDDTTSSLVTGENTTLNGSTESDSLIGVDILASLLSEVLLEHSLNLRDTGGTTDKDNVIDVALLELSVLENLLNWLERLLEQISVELFEFGAGKGLGKVLALVERFDLDLGCLLGRKRALGLFDLALQLTHGLRILGDVNALFLVVLLDEMVDDAVVEIFTTKVGVTGGRLNLEDALLNSQDGHIESTTSQIVDKDLAFLLVILFVKTVCECGGSGFVHHTEDVETGDSSSVLGGGTLSIVEVGGDSDDSVLDSLAEVAFSNLLHLAQDHSGDLFGCEGLLLALNLNLNAGLATLRNASAYT